MSELKQFRLPDVGEGLTEAEIVRWHVQPGDEVTINQIIVEIETAKAVVELPSPYAGVVAELLVPEGETADVGTPIISVEVGPDAGGDGPAPAGQPERRAGTAAPPRGGPALVVDRPPTGRARGRPSTARWHPRSALERPERTSARPCWSATASSSARPSAAPAGSPLPAACAPAAPAPGAAPAAHIPASPGRSAGPGRNASLRRLPLRRAGGRPCWPSRRSASWPGTSAWTWPGDRHRP